MKTTRLFLDTTHLTKGLETKFGPGTRLDIQKATEYWEAMTIDEMMAFVVSQKKYPDRYIKILKNLGYKVVFRKQFSTILARFFFELLNDTSDRVIIVSSSTVMFDALGELDKQIYLMGSNIKNKFKDNVEVVEIPQSLTIQVNK